MASSIDPVIHPINRLRICAALNNAGAIEAGKGGINYEMQFSRLQEIVELSDSALSKQISALEHAGYVTKHREYGSTRAKDSVWVALTLHGKRAFDSHVAALRELAGE